MNKPQPSEIALQPGRHWWENKALLAAVVLATMVPLLYPPIPPLVDLFGHMGRYRVQLDLATSPWLRQYFGFEWHAIGNLGVDLLIVPMSKLFGLELGVKLIVLTIPPLTAVGFLWVAREVHHRLPPTIFFALPFVYSHPFMFGFVNYALAMAFAFLAFGLWLRLARFGRFFLRALLFVPISFVIFFTHTYGWGALGLLAFSAEAVRQHDLGVGWIRAGLKAAGHAMVMALPVSVVLIWRSQVDGRLTFRWFDPQYKLEGLVSVLRDRWPVFDLLSLLVVIIIILVAIFHRRMTMSRNLAFSAIVLAAVYFLLPSTVFGSAFADMRLAPFMFAVALLAIRFRDDRLPPFANRLAVYALAFFLVRIAAHSWSLAITADDQKAKLEALDHVPMGARVASFAGKHCGIYWPLTRNAHLGAMVIVRREGFTNDQWNIEGTNPLRLLYKSPGFFASDPSEIVYPTGCRPRQWWIDRALRWMPRDKFDYVWLIDPPPYDPDLVSDLRLVWRGPDSVLYQVPK